MDVDPVVREDIRPVDHQGDADEVAIAEAAGRETDVLGGGRIQRADQLTHGDAGDEVGAAMRLGRTVFGLRRH